jgi:hypothetical protein
MPNGSSPGEGREEAVGLGGNGEGWVGLCEETKAVFESGELVRDVGKPPAALAEYVQACPEGVDISI